MNDWASYAYLIAAFILAGPALIYAFTRPGGFSNFLVWLAIFAALVLGYKQFGPPDGEQTPNYARSPGFQKNLSPKGDKPPMTPAPAEDPPRVKEI